MVYVIYSPSVKHEVNKSHHKPEQRTNNWLILTVARIPKGFWFCFAFLNNLFSGFKVNFELVYLARDRNRNVERLRQTFVLLKAVIAAVIQYRTPILKRCSLL